MNIRIFVCFSVCFLSSCATVGIGSNNRFELVGQDGYVLKVSDKPSESVFEIKLKSLMSRDICLSSQRWPDQSGNFSVQQEDIFVEVSSTKIPLRSGLASAYCPKGCGEVRVKPNSEIQGVIAYKSFTDESSLQKASSKRLNYVIYPYYCEKPGHPPD